MKKLLTMAMSVILCLCVALGLFACATDNSGGDNGGGGDTSAQMTLDKLVGTYKFQKEEATRVGGGYNDGYTKNVNEYYAGRLLTEDYQVLTINRDNTGTLSVTVEGQPTSTLTFTWEGVDGYENIKIVPSFTADYEFEMTGVCDGTTFTFTHIYDLHGEHYSHIYTLVKAN